MHRSFPVLPLAILMVAGCPPQVSYRSADGASATGGQTSSNGGQSGNGGAGGSSGSGGSATGGAGGVGGSGGSGGSGGEGGANREDASQLQDAADAASAGAGGGTGTARGGSGGTTTGQTGGATETGGRGGAGGTTATGGATGAGGKTGTGGASGMGGKIGTGGSGTGGSTAPTPCSFPSSWNPGSATYTTYSLPNASTACGYEGSNNTIKNIVNGANFAAIPGNTSSDFNTSNRCGACVQINSAVITIVDECPNDSNAPCKANPSGHLDLSNSGAGAAGVKGDPNVHGQAQWKFVPCPVNGNVIVRLKPGNSNEMFIENEILPLQTVVCGGQNGSRTSYGAWHFSSNIPGASCDLTDIAGRKITVTAGSTQGQNVDTGKQFPKCQ
jgi:hypothetical protein